MRIFIVLLLLSVSCFADIFDPNTYQPKYSENDPNIYDMSFFGMLSYESELLQDCNSVVLKARQSVDLCDTCTVDPNAVDEMTVEQLQAFEYVVLISRVRERILLFKLENGLLTRPDYDLAVLDNNEYTVEIICRCFGLKWGGK